MYKWLLLSIFLFGGCSYVTFNATMCDEIASDPQATVPQECQQYNEEKAQKAFDNKKETSTEISEIIEFNKVLEKNTTSQIKDDGAIEFKKE